MSAPARRLRRGMRPRRTGSTSGLSWFLRWFVPILTGAAASSGAKRYLFWLARRLGLLGQHRLGLPVERDGEEAQRAVQHDDPPGREHRRRAELVHQHQEKAAREQ